MAVPMGPWRRLGPALRGGPLPVVGATVSVLGHALFLSVLALVAGLWSPSSPSKVYVVNLVAGLSGPRSAPLLPSMPPPSPWTSPRLPREPSDLPPLPAATKPLYPSLPPALSRPEEPKPVLPPRLAESPRPPDLPPRTSRFDEKGQATERTSPPPEPRLAARPPAPSAGPTAVSAEVSDFPFAWYLTRVRLKVAERWAEQARISEPAQRPLIFVEILRDGSIKPPQLEKSSGNVLYDQAAVRAITEASPFPPLPQEWSRPTLRILFGFDVRPSQG